MTDVDQTARADATKALLLIASHEQVCAERQGHIIDSLGEIKSDVKGLYRRFWLAALSLITTLAGVVCSLVYIILSGHS